MERIFAVPIEAHEQHGIDVGTICWGTCGKGSVAGIRLGEYGSAIPCAQPPEACPHLMSDMPDPIGTAEIGEREYEVTLRRLLAPAPVSGSQGEGDHG